MQEPKHTRIRPTSKDHPAGAFEVLIRDADIPGVYTHLCQAHTWEDAIMIAGMIKDNDRERMILIQVAFEVN